MEPGSGAWSGGRIHRLPVRVYYEDTDLTGVVYHANHLKFMERGRTDALRCVGVGHAALLARDPPLSFAVCRMELEFIRPARIDDVLVVETVFEQVRGARLVVGQRIVRGARELLTATVQVACIDLGGRPRRLPAEMAGKITAHVSG